MALKIKRNSLDILFSRYIKLRDKYCQRCGGTGGLQAAHYHSRRKRSVRYDPDNCVLLCFGDHQYFHENPDEFKEFMKRRLGERGLDLLDSRARITWPRPDEKLTGLWLRAEIKRMEG